MTTGSNSVRASARTRRSTSSPSIFGSLRSSRTTCGVTRASRPAWTPGAEQIVERLHAVAGDDDLVADVRLLQGAKGERLVVRVVFHEQDLVGHHVASPSVK